MVLQAGYRQREWRGGRLENHTHYYWMLLAESHLTKLLLGSMLRQTAGLSLPAG